MKRQQGETAARTWEEAAGFVANKMRKHGDLALSGLVDALMGKAYSARKSEAPYLRITKEELQRALQRVASETRDMCHHASVVHVYHDKTADECVLGVKLDPIVETALSFVQEYEEAE